MILLFLFISIIPLSAEEASDPDPLVLVRAYPDFLSGYRDNRIVFHDGSELVWDAGVSRLSFDEQLKGADLKTQMLQRYPVPGSPLQVPGKNSDPGRLRSDAFFRRIYGHSEADVRRHLVSVRWVDGSTLRVTELNGVAGQLRKVVAELDDLPQLYMPWLTRPGGAFNWRRIAGTQRQSVHSYGIAVDINVARSDYWRWDTPLVDGSYPYKNSIPLEIVEIFERHGFIWGGRWYHYDTMHFEYRPELLAESAPDSVR